MKKLNMFAVALSGLLSASMAFGQATTSSGAIQGAVTDPTGAAIPHVAVTIKSDETGQVVNVQTDDHGVYSSGPLIPGHYTVTSSPAGFSAIRAKETVQISVVTNGNLKLAVGSSSTTIDISGTEVRVDTDQSQVQGVVTSEQIENLPIAGRNILDIAQLEPGVQLQDGQDFDPTKAGYSSVSFGGAYGRVSRILLDGQDISDQTVGTAVINVSQGSVEEVEINRSSLDISNELTSTGSVIISTRSGQNHIHGDAFYLFRDARAGFANGPGGISNPFQRSQFGGSIGGPIIKDKLFFFLNSEHNHQTQGAPVQFSGKFSGLGGVVSNSFLDTYSAARVDFNGPWGLHLYGRIAYESNGADATYGLGYSRYVNRDNTPAYVGGMDLTRGRLTSQIRVSYLKFHNFITDASAGTPYNPIPSIQLEGTGGLFTGPNYLAPQQTYQSNKQFSYNGSWTAKSHTIRFGANVNHILGGGLASFFGIGPLVAIGGTPVVGPCVVGGVYQTGCVDSQPLDYPTSGVQMGNGVGFATERPAFGYNAGGQTDWRTLIYIGDTWKVKPNLTVNYGVRYQRDTGLTDSDLAPIPCSDAVASFGSASPCASGNLFDSLQAGLGKRVRQPNADFGPQAGFAWDPKGNGKTVIRGGAGYYYENTLFNNVQFDRPGKLKSGEFFNEAEVCGQNPTTVPVPGGGTITSVGGTSIATLCAEPLSQSGAQFGALEAEYQAAVKTAGPQSNGAYIPNLLTNVPGGTPSYDPNFRTPRAIQMNIGFQRELWKGATISADYLRNVTTHFTQNVDINRDGAANTLNTTAAANAIATTLAACGAASIDAAIAPGGCAVGHGPNGNADIADFASNGLDSGRGGFLGNFPASFFGATPDTGAAFPGVNPLWGAMEFVEANGRSVYNGLQMSFKQQQAHPFPGIVRDDLQVSYSLSRLETSASVRDNFFSNTALDNDTPNAYMGPGSLDRTHMLSFGGYFDVKYGAKIGFVGHVFSALPTSLSLEADPNGDNGEIFRTDVTGDGTTGDLLPGTKNGAFMRNGIKGNTINRVIDNYNATAAGRLTPAGQALVNSGLMTAQELTELGGVTPSIERALPNQVNNGWLRTMDLNLSYPFRWAKLGDKFEITPGISFFNLFNFANFGGVNGNVADGLNGVLESTSSDFVSAKGTSANAVNTTTPTDRNIANRLADGSGTFAQGAYRQTEFSLNIKF